MRSGISIPIRTAFGQMSMLTVASQKALAVAGARHRSA
ncbi:MAG: hypothetical protein EOS31_12335 [Mesorhizobium sp.]|nr:hypothetical protein EN753_35370 [Mesorhizobium sp. M2A.F.Ca.ET.029.05.1.1]RWC83393.1 MAG: hypothetical protein EOS31_12335 [Mesorhizobium sp.]RWF55708.1 MAG: hypothetical protein EOS66_12550 [Mesorhizobium sp.]